MNNDSVTQNLLAHPFRPFFLLTGVYAVLVVVAWMAFLFGGWPLPVGWSPLSWHSHEMLYGLVPAAIAGFMLTAMTNWTSAAPLNGYPLLALIALWIAGRVAMWLAGWLPVSVVALIDLAFLPVLAVYVGRTLLRHNNRRNLILVAILTLLFLGNLLMHIGFVTGTTHLLKYGHLLGFNLITLMMVVIAGRITPAFTANWLRMNGGNPEWVTRSVWTDRLAIGSVILLVAAELLRLPASAIGIVAILAGIINGIRLAQWAGWRARKEPLLWILHLAYFWIALSLLLRGLAIFTALGDSLWQHSLGIGGIGVLLLGVMTRVAVGHTGRPLKLVRFGLIIYLAIVAAAVLRMLVALQMVDYRLGVSLSAIFWVLAFALFVILYWPILSKPRADGRPG